MTHSDTSDPMRATLGTKSFIAYPAAVMVAMGIGSLALGIVFFAREVHGASASRIGLLASTWSLSYVVGCMFLRPVVDRLLPRHSIMIATLAMGTAIAGVLVAPRLWMVFLLYVMYGTATAFFWPPLMGWLSTGLEGATLNRAMGRFNLSWSTGGIVGPAMAGFLAARDPRLPIAMGAGLYLTAFVGICLALRCLPGLDSQDVDHRHSVAGSGRLLRPGSEGSFLRYPAWIGLVATYVILGVLINVFPLAAQDNLGLSKPMVGLLLFVRALATSATLVVLGRTTAWHFRGSQLLAGLGVFGLVMFLLPSMRTPAALVALMPVIGVLVALSYANSLFHGVTGSRHRAARMAIHEALLSVGLVFGSSLGGAIYQFDGYESACRFAGSTMCLAFVLGSVLLLRARHRGMSLQVMGAQVKPSEP